ncbi:hypothetical protein ABK040_013793 [Willaertia magna]
MTEFYDLGKHCAVDNCHQKDFLPFFCEHCKHHYCKDHREYFSHSCTFQIEKELQKSTIPTCPSCKQLISKNYPQEDNEIVIKRHLQYQCGKNNNNLQQKKCSFKHCNNHEEKIFMDCNDCHQSFCLTHRLPEEHECCKREEKNKSNSSNTLLNKLHQERTKKKSLSTTVTNSKSVNNNLQLNNNKAIVPLKGKELDDNDSIIVNTIFLNQNNLNLLKLSKMWSIGKTLDILADYNKIKNDNNKINCEKNNRLYLYKIITNNNFELLNTSKRVGEILMNGDVIVLLRGEMVKEREEEWKEFKVYNCKKEVQRNSYLNKLQSNYKQIFVK